MTEIEKQILAKQCAIMTALCTVGDVSVIGNLINRVNDTFSLMNQFGESCEVVVNDNDKRTV